MSIQEVMYRLRSRRGWPVTIRELVEGDLASVYIPRPPPGIGRWTSFEIEVLTAEVLERQRRGIGLLASWEIESTSAEFEVDHFDFNSDEVEWAFASSVASEASLAA